MKQPVSSKQRHRAARRRWFASDHEKKVVDAHKPQKRRYLRDYLNWLWPYRWALGMLFTLSFIAAMLDMVWPYAIKKIMDLLTLPSAQMAWEKKSHLLNLFGASVVVFLVAKQLVDTVRNYQSVTLNAKMIFRLRKKLFAKLLGLPLSELSEMKSGGITSRLSGDIDSVNNLVNLALINPSIALLRVVLTVTIIFWLSAMLPL